MPMGNNTRLEAVLRAGELQRQVMATGKDPPGKALQKAGSTVKKLNAATKPALKGGKSAPTVMARKAQALKADDDDEGDFGGAQAMEGFGNLGSQGAVSKVGKFDATNKSKSMAWMNNEWKRMMNEISMDYKKNTDALTKAREQEEKWVEEHHKLMSARDDEYKERMERAIKEIEEQLKQKNDLLDKCQEGEQGNSSRVQELELRVKTMNEDHIQAVKQLKEDNAQDAAAKALAATAELKTANDKVASLQKEMARLSEVATKDNKANQQVLDELQACRKATLNQRKEFKKAQEAACKALEAALKAMNDAAGKQGLPTDEGEKERKDYATSVTSASAEAM